MIKQEGLRMLAGKTIKSIVVNQELPKSPHNQLFIVFSDDTYFEIYGDFQAAGGVDRGDENEATSYAKVFPGGTIKKIF